MERPLYELRGVGRTFRRGDATIAALDSVDLTIAPGEIVAVEGTSGPLSDPILFNGSEAVRKSVSDLVSQLA